MRTETIDWLEETLDEVVSGLLRREEVSTENYIHVNTCFGDLIKSLREELNDDSWFVGECEEEKEPKP